MRVTFFLLSGSSGEEATMYYPILRGLHLKELDRSEECHRKATELGICTTNFYDFFFLLLEGICCWKYPS